jgi:molybdate transport system substrate-binding protein
VHSYKHTGFAYIFCFFLITAACSSTRSTPRPTLTIAAAASLSNAFSELANKFTHQTNIEITLSFAATGTLSEQIANGAPFDLFATADPSYVDDLVVSGHIDESSRSRFACGKLVLATHPSNSFLVQSLNDITNPALNRIAIANPDIAPYGAAARQLLQSANIWKSIQDKIVYGDNVRQIYQYLDTGDVKLAILPRSLLRNTYYTITTIDSSYYDPIEHIIGINTNTTQRDQAQLFIEYLFSSGGKTILSDNFLTIEACNR